MSKPKTSQSNANNANFSQENIATTVEQIKKVSNDFKNYHHFYYNPKSEDKSNIQSKGHKGLHINYELITRNKHIDKLEDEPEHYYQLLLFYAEYRSYQQLIDSTLIKHQVKLNRRQIFYISKKYNWKTRIEKFDSEINYEIMSELYGKCLQNRRNRLENILEIYENANNLISTFHNEITSDMQVLTKYNHFDDEMKLKRAKDVLRIYNDYTKLTEKIEEIIEKENMNNFNNSDLDNLENLDEIIEEMEKTDEISATWNKFQVTLSEEMLKYQVENEKFKQDNEQNVKV